MLHFIIAFFRRHYWSHLVVMDTIFRIFIPGCVYTTSNRAVRVVTIGFKKSVDKSSQIVKCRVN